MKQPTLPPLVGKPKAGEVTWEKINPLDYAKIGYFLSCHLVLENYIDAVIKAKIGKNFSLEKAKLSFSQKIEFLSPLPLPERFNFFPSLKHINILRNKLAHNINSEISEKTLLPVIQYLSKACEKQPPKNPIAIMESYTTFTCAWLGATYVYELMGLHIEDKKEYQKWAERFIDENLKP